MAIILLRMTPMTLCQRESVKCCVIDALYGIIKQKGCLDDVKNYTNWWDGAMDKIYLISVTHHWTSILIFFRRVMHWNVAIIQCLIYAWRWGVCTPAIQPCGDEGWWMSLKVTVYSLARMWQHRKRINFHLYSISMGIACYPPPSYSCILSNV